MSVALQMKDKEERKDKASREETSTVCSDQSALLSQKTDLNDTMR